jgi:5'-nucleotidase
MIRSRYLAAPLVLALALTAACSSGGSSGSTASSSSSGSSASGEAASSSADRPLQILVSNDDGVAAPGIDTLAKALSALPNVVVTVSAPAANQSGTGGKTTPGGVTGTPATTASGLAATSVDGFPADAVAYGLATVLKGVKPDLVVSGVNNGQNLGPVIDLSGTVGAARVGAAQHIPAIAVSAGLGDNPNFADGAAAVVSWVTEHRADLLGGTADTANVLSINTPTCTAGAVRGILDVPAAPDAGGRNVIPAADCASTTPVPAGADDVTAFALGYTTRSLIPVAPTPDATYGS